MNRLHIKGANNEPDLSDLEEIENRLLTQYYCIIRDDWALVALFLVFLEDILNTSINP